jgi:predicted aspartyl protease
MPVIKIRTSFEGRSGVKTTTALANSLSDFVIITKQVADAIDPEPLGYEQELEVGGGGTIRGPVYRVKVQVKDEKSEEREAEVKAILLEGERIPILGLEALEKLRILLDIPEGRFSFENSEVVIWS